LVFVYIFFFFSHYLSIKIQNMSTLTSRDHLVQRHPTVINKTSPEFKNNVEEWQVLIDDLKERLKEATGEGKPKSIALHRKRGQLSGML
jgi:hypothetical protein